MNTFVFLCYFTLSLYPYHTASQASGNVTDGQMHALMSLKDMVFDPLGSLLSWNSSNHPCRWRGVGCSREHGDRIVELNLNSFGLIGGISPLVGNLSYLRVLNLGANQLVGQIPTDLGRLRRLRVLNLTMNSLKGDIRTSLGGCTQLMKLTLDSNHLQDNQWERRHLSLAQRMSILLDVAHALDYLHCNGTGPIVHCDLKPSNVLLDSNMVAHVGDFGLARILEEGCSYFQHPTNSMGFGGTIGYAPPEYGAGNMVSTHGDIYSYGILVLELITGKRPTDNMFCEGLSLRNSVEMAFDNRALDIVDVVLAKELQNSPATADDPTNQTKINSMISLLKLGIFCTEDMPSSRISTKDIIKELHAVKF